MILLLLAVTALQTDTLPRREKADTLEELTVSATRTNRRVPDEPTRVEVLGRAEIAEKLLMTPGDIQMLLNESSGLRVQNTSPRSAAPISGSRGSAAATPVSSPTAFPSPASRPEGSACSRSPRWTSARWRSSRALRLRSTADRPWAG